MTPQPILIRNTKGKKIRWVMRRHVSGKLKANWKKKNYDEKRGIPKTKF